MDDDANKRGRNKPESTYSEFFVEVFWSSRFGFLTQSGGATLMGREPVRCLISTVGFLLGHVAGVCYWPKADMPKNAIDVAIGGKADMAYCTAHVRF